MSVTPDIHSRVFHLICILSIYPLQMHFLRTDQPRKKNIPTYTSSSLMTPSQFIQGTWIFLPSALSNARTRKSNHYTGMNMSRSTLTECTVFSLHGLKCILAGGAEDLHGLYKGTKRLCFSFLFPSLFVSLSSLLFCLCTRIWREFLLLDRFQKASLVPKRNPFLFFPSKASCHSCNFSESNFLFSPKKTSIGQSTGDMLWYPRAHPLPGRVTSHRGGIDMTANSTNVPLIIQEKAVDLPRSVLLRCSLPRNTGEKGSLGRCNMARLARLINSFFSVLLLLTQAL